MTQIRFREHDGTEHVLDAVDGQSLMQVALAHDVPELQGECGGILSCGTCHTYIEPPFLELLPPASEAENAIIEYTINPRPNSRLTCQIVVEPGVEGMTVNLPKPQL